MSRAIAMENISGEDLILVIDKEGQRGVILQHYKLQDEKDTQENAAAAVSILEALGFSVVAETPTKAPSA